MYKVGDKILIEGIITDDVDCDGEFEVELSNCYGSWDNTFIAPRFIYGKVEDYPRIPKPFQIGDVLKKGDISCVLFKEVTHGFQIIFNDGSVSFRSTVALEEGFTRTGINIGENVGALLSALSEAKERV